MPVPPELAQAIQHEIESLPRADLARAAAELTQIYKAEKSASPTITTPAHRAAYLAVRLPATFAANLAAFSEVRRLATETKIESMLDLGTGPGTALWAATGMFPEMTQATLVESDRSLIETGKRLCGQNSHPAIRSASWLQQDLSRGLNCEPHDLVVISYALGELPASATDKLISQAWNCTKEFLVIVEPGTMRGFNFIDLMRSKLIASGAYILAPCPHALTCPMAAAGDWCHFAARVQRSSLHRQIKGGTLGYEDEKFSYVVAGRQEFPRPLARIVRHPQQHSGHIQLTLCTPDGLKSVTITKSQKDQYRLARKAEWGDEWEDESREVS